MKRFSYKLKRVLDLKKIHEMGQKRELGVQLRDLNAIDGRLKSTSDLKDSFDREFNGVDRQGSLDPVLFRRYHSYQNVLSGEIRNIEGEKEKQNKVVDEARLNVKSAMSQSQIFEKIKENCLKSYWAEVNKESEKDTGEIVMARYQRKMREKGSALNVLLAAGASGFLIFCFLLGMLFAFGNLDMHRLRLIASILRYDQDYSKAYRLYGAKNPNIIMSDDYDKLKDIEKHYVDFLERDVDEQYILTRDVVKVRKEVLRVVEEGLERTRKAVDENLKKTEANKKAILAAQEKLNKEQAEFNTEVEGKANEQKESAQEQMLQAMKSMEPEDIVKMLIGGKDFQTLNRIDQKENLSRLGSYLSKMTARQ
ncbi:MAG: flagellar FliJ family protein, partial [Planctomycetes bacterium]|nr:flagellar FliJ family protein [Planctomycetota bacterium]